MIQVIIITLPQRWNNWEREMKPVGPDIQWGRFGRELQCSALDMFIFVSLILMLRFPWMLLLSSWHKWSGRKSAEEKLVLTCRTQGRCLLHFSAILHCFSDKHYWIFQAARITSKAQQLYWSRPQWQCPWRLNELFTKSCIFPPNTVYSNKRKSSCRNKTWHGR